MTFTRSKRDTILAAVILAVVGFAVYWTGLGNQFAGDDFGQIVTNVPVHSATNISQFFEHSTFYSDQWIPGAYYRPLMTTTFSALYTLFGANPLWFHLLQLVLQIVGAYVLFLVLRYFLRPMTSLVVALVFLVHPIDSQAVFSIAAMQEPLFFLFGILAFWTLLRFYYRSARWLILTAALLLLSLLSKETGILFVAMGLVYSFMRDEDRRKRFYPLLGLSLAALVIYLLLRLHAIGFAINPAGAPIDNLNLAGRLMNIPAILMFYLTKFIFPASLAHYYYWVYPSFTIRRFLWPLVVDVAAVSSMVYLARLVRRKAAEDRYAQLFLFFSLWLLAGLLMTLPWIPLDMTASETWFLFPMVGVLGMIGVLAEVFPLHLPRRWVIAAVLILIAVLGVRTAIRGFNWRNIYTLADHDITVSKEDYNSLEVIGYSLAENGNLAGAVVDERRSIALYQSYSNYEVLGRILDVMGKYPQAKLAYTNGLRYSADEQIYRDLAQLATQYGDPEANRTFIEDALGRFPQDATLWFYLAILEYRQGDSRGAKAAISRARDLGNIDQTVYYDIINDKQFSITYALGPATP